MATETHSTLLQIQYYFFQPYFFKKFFILFLLFKHFKRNFRSIALKENKGQTAPIRTREYNYVQEILICHKSQIYWFEGSFNDAYNTCFWNHH